jgi:hypothetical protein
MRQIWTTALASFSLAGFAAVVSATAIAVSAEHPDTRTEGRTKMVEAQYGLGISMR